MRTDLCDRFGIDYPIFAFTPSERVAAVRFNEADDLETVLRWMDEKPTASRTASMW